MEAPINEAQVWDSWNSTYRQGRLDDPRNAAVREILASLVDLKIHAAKILEVGCGTGWLSSKLCEFGDVTAVDLGKEIIETAKTLYPAVDFRSGDIHTLDLPVNSFDVIVTLETLSHVPDQPGFLHRLSQLLKPGGFLLITTQNKSVFERRADIGPPKWLDTKLGYDENSQALPSSGFLHPNVHFTLEPEGHKGLLRLINSARINHYLGTAVGAPRVKRLKESAGFGQTIFVIAVKR